MKKAPRKDKRRGAALMAVLLVMLAVMAIIVVASTTTLNARLISKNSERAVVLYDAAEGGIEEIRNLINTHPGDSNFFKDSGETMLENHVPVKDANGVVIPHVYRTTWAGPSFSTTGEFGIFGTIIAKVEDDYGNVVYHRGTVFQDTFAKFAYFSNSEGGICFGGGDQLYGPVHTNDNMCIAVSGVEFHDKVTVHGTIAGKGNGIFDAGFKQKSPAIAMPPATAIAQLRTLANQGGTWIVGDGTGGQGEATTRIEFVAIDLNGDGDTNDENEGFFKVWRAQTSTVTNAQYIVAANTGNPNAGGMVTQTTGRANDNCGVDSGTKMTLSSSVGTIPLRQAFMLPSAASGLHAKCYLGGDSHLNTVTENGFYVNNPHGHWVPSPTGVLAVVAATGRADSAYLWPISHTLNSNFKGVIEVDGKVAISGVVRGRLTLAASSDIVIADDIVLNDNASSDCLDYLGLFAAGNVVMADNMMNSPQTLGIGPPDTILHMSATPDEFVQASVLALGGFVVQNYSTGVPQGEPCGALTAGRGCLYLTGGIIQGTRGPVGTLNGGGTAGVYGYIKRYSFNQCGLTDPPPYFPLVGRFSGNRTYEMDPVGMDIHPYYRIPKRVSLVKVTPPPPPPPPPAPGPPPKPAPPPPPPVPKPPPPPPAPKPPPPPPPPPPLPKI